MRVAEIERRLRELEAHRRAPAAAKSLSSLLARLGRAEMPDAERLGRFHDALLFLCAYPPTEATRRRAESLLKRFGRRALAMAEAGTLDPQLDPEISGIAGTTIAMEFSWEALRWLARRHPGAFAIDWEIEVAEERLARALVRLVPFLEEEAAADANVDYAARLRAASRASKDGGARWLIAQLERLELPERDRAALWESMGLTIRWRLGESADTRTRMRRAPRKTFHQRAPLLSRGEVSLERELQAPPLLLRRLSKREGEAFLDQARAAMATRYRELHVFTFGDPASCVRADAGRGLEIVVNGIVAERRLPLRAGFGLVFFRNGVPIGYADAFGVCERIEVSFNIFPAFRDGENAYCFARMLRLHRQLFGSTAFAAEPYQIGLGNEEAIEAGAFWFYRKLGFRSVEPAVERIVLREEKRIADDPRHRTPARTLRRIAQSPLLYEVPGSGSDEWSRFRTRHLGEAVARRFAAFGGPAEAFTEACREHAGRVLGMRERTLAPGTRRALDALAPLLGAIPGLGSWPAEDRARLREAVLAKAGRSERGYLRRLARHARFRDALLKLGTSGR